MIRNFNLIVLLICMAAVVGMAPPQDLDRTARLMEELTNAPGPPGFEGPVRDIVVRELEALGIPYRFFGHDSAMSEVINYAMAVNTWMIGGGKKEIAATMNIK